MIKHVHINNLISFSERGDSAQTRLNGGALPQGRNSGGIRLREDGLFQVPLREIVSCQFEHLFDIRSERIRNSYVEYPREMGFGNRG
jgi:hypothetical protein